MERELTKELAQKLIKIKGECRGIHLKNDAEYILKEKGEAGLRKVEAELERLGFPIDYKKAKNLEFHPTGLRFISLLAAKKVFGWSDDDIKEMCRFAAKTSFVVKLYLKYFYSIPRVLGKVSKMWREYWTEGNIVIKKHNEEEKRLVLRVEEFESPPIYCRCLEGYFEGITKMVTRVESPRCREIPSKDKTVCEFLIEY